VVATASTTTAVGLATAASATAAVSTASTATREASATALWTRRAVSATRGLLGSAHLRGRCALPNDRRADAHRLLLGRALPERIARGLNIFPRNIFTNSRLLPLVLLREIAALRRGTCGGHRRRVIPSSTIDAGRIGAPTLERPPSAIVRVVVHGSIALAHGRRRIIHARDIVLFRGLSRGLSGELSGGLSG
jgi:hypothetical protein